MGDTATVTNQVTRRGINRLTDAAIKAAAPREKQWKFSDGAGLFVLVRPNGAKWWRWNYSFGTRRKTLSFGVYPSVGLAEARRRVEDAKRLLRDGKDPSVERRRSKRARDLTVSDLWREWSETREAKYAPATRHKRKWIVDRLVLPALGRHPVSTLRPTDVVDALRPFDLRGIAETTHRAKQMIGQLLQYAVAHGYAERNFIPDLRGAFLSPKTTNFPTLTDPAEIGALLRAIDGYQGTWSVAAALRMAPHVFVRPVELRKATWSEIDEADALWRIPAERMKSRRSAHLVPLSRQVLDILHLARRLNDRESRYVFPCTRASPRPLSDMALNAALRRMGYTHDQIVTHGFRAMASTRMNEMGWDAELIEIQLSHKDPSAVRAAYNRSVRLEERRELMQRWSDYLDTLKASTGLRQPLAP